MTTPRRARTTRPDPRDPYGTDSWDDEGYEYPPRRGWSLSPGIVMMAIALFGSVAFSLYVITVRDASQIPLMASGAVVLAIVFLALAIYGMRAAWLAGVDRRNGRAIAIGLAGGIAALIGTLAAAGAIILFLLATSPRT